MNMCLKGHHFTRKIDSVMLNEQGHVLVHLKSHYPFIGEHLLFLPNEVIFDEMEAVIHGTQDQVLDKNVFFMRNRLFSRIKMSAMRLLKFFGRLFTGGFFRSDS